MTFTYLNILLNMVFRQKYFWSVNHLNTRNTNNIFIYLFVHYFGIWYVMYFSVLIDRHLDKGIYDNIFG